jgi:hypothetical protein
MRLPRTPLALSLPLAGLLCNPLPVATAQAPTPQAQAGPAAEGPSSSETALLQALAADPLTAPYAFATTLRGGRVVLLGRVGTKVVHDAAVRIAIASGIPFVDQLVIDTAAARQVALRSAALAGPGLVPTQAYGPLAGTGSDGAYGIYSGPGFSYVYPPPLFGRFDDPFWGLEPPIISYPPWWAAMSARRLNEAAIGLAPVAPSQPAAPIAPPSPSTGAPAQTSSGGGATVEMTIDPRGVATLRGTVPTLADRIAVGQRLAQTPGIAEVVNLIDVKETAAGPIEPAPPGEVAINPDPIPPPPPQAEPARGAIAPDEDDLERRIDRALARRPDLSKSAIQVSARNGAVTLTGKVASIYEAMLAFRAVQQTPGVREVVDRLEFPVPDEDHKNPLLSKGRPEDVEPYLEAQVRRQVADQAHIDRIRLRGDLVEIQGTLARAEDRPRVEAILRSIPALRGYQIDPHFVAE